MSELKAISGHEIREDIDYNTRGVDPENKEWRNYGKELCDTLYYRKTEADKVITELKAQKAQAETDCAYWKMREDNAVNTMHETEEACMFLTKSERHQKYKRCVAMAKWCLFWENYWHCCEPADLGAFIARERFFCKWKKRWLELAEKFKPNSTAQ